MNFAQGTDFSEWYWGAILLVIILGCFLFVAAVLTAVISGIARLLGRDVTQRFTRRVLAIVVGTGICSFLIWMWTANN